MQLQILDLDGSLATQQTLRDAAPWSTCSVVALNDLATRLRLWSRARTMRLARERIPAPAPCSDAQLSLLGSGDFHHLATLLIERVAEPVTLIHLDNHPDWVRLAPRWHCGSWVNQALTIPNVHKVITLGPCSDDLVRPGLKGGNLPALASGKLALFPWRHAPSRVFHAINDGPGHHYDRGYLHWHNLGEHAMAENIQRIVAEIKTAAIWLSIDKDVLVEADALTNWDQGEMPLSALLALIAGIGSVRRIVGADICGEFSIPLFDSRLKRIESRMDRPQHALDANRLARNEEVNRALLSCIERAAETRGAGICS